MNIVSKHALITHCEIETGNDDKALHAIIKNLQSKLVGQRYDGIDSRAVASGRSEAPIWNEILAWLRRSV